MDRGRGLLGADGDDQADAAEPVEVLEAVDQVGADDERLGVAMLEHRLQERAPAVGVQRDADAAPHLRAVEGGQELELVAEQQADVRAGLEAVAVEGVPDPADPAPAVGEREPVDAVEHDPVPVAVAARPVGDHPQHRALLRRVAERERAEAEPAAGEQGAVGPPCGHRQ